MATQHLESAGVNEFESTLGGVTVHGKAHSLSAWFVLALRLMMGGAFAWAGFEKLTAAEQFSAVGYLAHAVPKASPMYDTFQWMANTTWFAHFLAVAVPWGELLIGVALLLGVVTRFAAFWGAFMMVMFYFSNWDVANGYINGQFAYMLVFLAVAAFGAGRILGLDAYVERMDVGGQTLVEKYPILDYVLG